MCRWPPQKKLSSFCELANKSFDGYVFEPCGSAMATVAPTSSIALFLCLEIELESDASSNKWRVKRRTQWRCAMARTSSKLYDTIVWFRFHRVIYLYNRSISLFPSFLIFLSILFIDVCCYWNQSEVHLSTDAERKSENLQNSEYVNCVCDHKKKTTNN